MEAEAAIKESRVKATLKLGEETYSIEADKSSAISQESVSMKQKSMTILKEFISKHNVPDDVPDELLEEPSSEDDDEVAGKPIYCQIQEN